MSAHNIPLSIRIRKTPYIIPNLQLCVFFFRGLKNEFETAVVNEPSVFEPPKVCCIYRFDCHLSIRIFCGCPLGILQKYKFQY